MDKKISDIVNELDSLKNMLSTHRFIPIELAELSELGDGVFSAKITIENGEIIRIDGMNGIFKQFKNDMENILESPVTIMGLSKVKTKLLIRSGYLFVKDITSIREKDLYKINGIGMEAVAKIKKCLSDCGLGFMPDK